MRSSTRADKARGLLFGLALGDCLGAPFEDKAGVTDADIVSLERATEPLIHTDDTALALVLARHLARRTHHAGTPASGGSTDVRDEAGGAARPEGRNDAIGAVVEQDLLAREFAEAWLREPWRCYGGGVARAFDLMTTGTPWREATRAIFADGSFGNGGAMRVAPVALVGAGPSEVAALARRTAEVTHGHEDALHGTVCQAIAVRSALDRNPADPVDAREFTGRLAEAVPSAAWHGKLARVAELARNGAEPDEAATVLGNDVTALGSVPLAVLAFLGNTGDPAGTIRYAIRAGGDTDTIAAMAGAIAGAHTGASALAPYLLTRLEAGNTLHTLAAELA